MELMQLAEGPEVEVQILRVEFEAFCELIDGLLELHQGDPDVLDLFGRQGLFLEASDGLALHQLADEFDEAEHELDDGTLDVFRIRIPSQRGRLWPAPHD